MPKKYKLSHTAEELDRKLTTVDELSNSVSAIIDTFNASKDDDIIDVLIQADMLPAVTDADGSILTDENNSIILW